MDDNMNTDRARMPDDHDLTAIQGTSEVPDTDAAPHSAGSHTPDEDSLSRSVMRLGRLLMRHEHITRDGRRGRSARVGQGRVLALLALREPLAQKDLAFLLGVRPQSLSELLGKLEHAGLVERQRDEADRRSTLVSLTAEGRGAAEEATRSGASDTDPFDVLDEDERAELARLVGKVSQGLIEADGEPGPRGPRGDGPHRGGKNRRGHGSPWEGGREGYEGGREHDPEHRRHGEGRRGRDEDHVGRDARHDRGATEQDRPARDRGRRGHRWGRGAFRTGGPAWA